MPGQADRVDRIAFISNQGQIGTIAPDGSAMRLLTDTERIFQFPAWSPDGRTLATVGGDGDRTGVFVVADGDAAEFGLAHAELIYSSPGRPPIYLYWRPDGAAVSFIAAHPNGLALHQAARDGQARILATGQPCFWAWAPDGQRLIVHTGGAGDEGSLLLLDAEGRRAGRSLPRPGLFQSPSFAPDGRGWAFAELDILTTTQVVIARQGSRLRTVAGYMGVAALGWSPTGQAVAFSSPRSPARHCYGPLTLVDVESERRRLLVNDTVLAFFWSPDGRSIAYMTFEGVIRERVRPASVQREGNGASTEPDPPLTETISLALWVVDVATGASRRLLAFQPLPLFINQFLPFFDQYAHSHRIWSPDSDAIVLPALGVAGPQILVVPTGADPPRTLVSGIMAFWSQN
jgi:TolB protein